MSNKKEKLIYRFDNMVFIGIGLTAAYWILEAFLYVLIYGNTTFLHRLVGLDVNELAMRMLVLAFFLIFGSHAQFTITQRRKSDEALRQTEGKYETIIESIEDGYYELDSGGRIIFCNDSMNKILGYTDDDLNHFEFKNAMADADADNFVSGLNQVRKTGQPLKHLDVIINGKDGSPIFVETSVSTIKDSKNRVKGFRGILRDVTRRKQAEALQQEKIAAEAASRYKSEFLANMSHEIRTPLNSIIGLVELTLESELPQDQHEDLSVVLSASYGLLAIINDILDFSKIEAGKLELEETDFSLRTFLSESTRILAGKAHSKGLEIAYRVQPSVPDKLTGDPSRLRQVVLNLMGNAIKFTDTGEVIVSVSIEERSENDIMLLFSVKDTGIGIPYEKKETIFEAFSQADGTTSRRYGGTGLGLTVSAQIVGLMKGKIWVDSTPNKGSTFYFTSLFRILPEKPETLPLPHDLDLSGIRVLVVDDNSTTRDIIKETLESWRMFPITASSVEQAQQILRQKTQSGIPFDMAIIDSEMPGLDGFSLVRWVNNNPDVKLTVIMMFTHTVSRSKMDLKELGVKAILNKPVTHSDLLQSIRNALGVGRRKSTDQDLDLTEEKREFDRPLKLLVAEDLPFNQKFILRLLDRWGHDTTLVENGREAVEACINDNFDLVLMDVQMPEMDGLEATRKIREHEKTAQTHTPIIAMTAHAMKGDRQKCIDSGMDDYVSKPISSDILLRAMLSLVSNGHAKAMELGKERQASEDKPILDKDTLLKAFNNDSELAKDLIEIFIADYPDLMEKLRSAIKDGDAVEMRRHAHSIKGMLKNFQADTAAEIALKIEGFSDNEQFSKGEHWCDALSEHLEALKINLEKIVQKID